MDVLAPLTLHPHPYAGRHRQWLITKFEGNLPSRLCPGRGSHIGPDLGNWLRTSSQLLDRNLTRCPGWGPRRSVTWNSVRLFGSTLPLFNTTSRRRRSLVLALGLLWLSCGTSAGQEPIDGHCMLSHHLFTLICLYFRGINRLGC